MRKDVKFHQGTGLGARKLRQKLIFNVVSSHVSSYAVKMVEVMKELQRHRQSSNAFAGRHGFITGRDLFRWAERHANVSLFFQIFRASAAPAAIYAVVSLTRPSKQPFFL